MAQAVEQAEAGRQLALYGIPDVARRARTGGRRRQQHRVPLCAGCRAREARYGFSDDDAVEGSRESRPRALCFECFRMELERRQAVTARLAREWNARQVGLPLEVKLQDLARRRRRAQIAARHALGL